MNCLMPNLPEGQRGVPSEYAPADCSFGLQCVEERTPEEAAALASRVLNVELARLVVVLGHFQKIDWLGAWTYRPTGFMVFVRNSSG